MAAAAVEEEKGDIFQVITYASVQAKEAQNQVHRFPLYVNTKEATALLKKEDLRLKLKGIFQNMDPNLP